MKRPDIEAIRQSPRQWCDMPTVEKLSDYAMLIEDENAALKEQVAAWKLTAEQHKETADIINGALRVQVAQLKSGISAFFSDEIPEGNALAQEMYMRGKQYRNAVAYQDESISIEQHNRLIEVLRTRHEVDLACVHKKLIEAQKDAAPEWISVNARLPNDTEAYLCFIVTNEGTKKMEQSSMNPVMTGFYVEYDACGIAPIEKVTHWMPLPAAPKQEKWDETNTING